MQDSIEVLLQIDALREAVGADEHIFTGRPPAASMRVSRSDGGQQTRHGFNADFGWERLAQLTGHVIGRVHEPAKDHRAGSRP